MDILYSSGTRKPWEEQQEEMTILISAFHMLAIIFPVAANTFSHNERIIMDVVNSKNVLQCDIGFVSDYIDVKINQQIFADEMDERWWAVQNVLDFMKLLIY